jgi:hypothetical protein
MTAAMADFWHNTAMELRDRDICKPRHRFSFMPQIEKIAQHWGDPDYDAKTAVLYYCNRSYDEKNELLNKAALTKLYLISAGEHLADRIRQIKETIEQVDSNEHGAAWFQPFFFGLTIGLLETFVFIDQQPECWSVFAQSTDKPSISASRRQIFQAFSTVFKHLVLFQWPSWYNVDPSTAVRNRLSVSIKTFIRKAQDHKGPRRKLTFDIIAKVQEATDEETLERLPAFIFTNNLCFALIGQIPARSLIQVTLDSA